MIRQACPRLAVRLFLIMVVGLVAATFVSRWLVQTFYTNELARMASNAAIERIGEVIRVLDAMPPRSRADAGRAFASERLAVSWPPALRPVIGGHPEIADRVARSIHRTPALLRFETLAPAPCASGPSADDCSARAKRFAVELPLADGQPVRIEYTTRYVSMGRGNPLSWGVGLGALGLVVWISVRIATRPLEVLAQHAEALGRNLLRPPLDEKGPIEVRRAARAFNAMQARILQQVNERTRMLAAISHDLKTPLTRMRLRMEQIADDALRSRLNDDLGSMRQLIDEGLALARSLDTQEAPQRLDLSALLEALCDDAREAGQAVRFVGAAGVVLNGQAQALRRAFLNLIDNAVQYGGSADVSVRRTHSDIRVTVRDRGAGIPPEHLENVLKPYFRLEGSRCRETGGTGLGLAIAANLVAAQGGRLTLRNHPEGGLEAEVVLPNAV